MDRRFDPDSQLIERVFQPLVDRFSLDPKAAAPGACDAHSPIGIIGVAALLVGERLLGLFTPANLYAGFVLASQIFVAAVVRHAVNAAAAGRPDIFRTARRIFHVGITILLTPLCGWAFLSSDWTRPLSQIGLGMIALAYPIGTCALYLSACRKPPPRRRHPDRPPSRALVRA